MAATLSATLQLTLGAIYANTSGLAGMQATISKSLIQTLASGTGLNQADKIFSESAKSISGNYDVDLAGVLTDSYGAALTFARVKGILITADAANPGNIIVGAAGATIFFGPWGANTHTNNVRPGGALLMFAPDATAWPVGAGATDVLRFAPSAGTCLFDWAVFGASV